MIANHQIAETAMNALWSYYESGAIDESIGIIRQFGHTTEAIDCALNPDSYYFPNIRGDRIVKPATVDDDQIPVIALENGRAYHFERPSLHSLQKMALINSEVSVSTINATEQEFNSLRSHKISTSGGVMGTASVYARLHYFDRNVRAIESKPTIIFNLDPFLTKPPEDLTSVALHEVVHVAQALSSPVRSNEINAGLERELQAYGVQAALVHNFAVPYTLSTAAAGEVELFRKRHLGESVYKPTPGFIEAFKSNQLFARIVNSIE